MANQLVDNQKIGGGIISTAGANTNVWYQREDFDRFSVNGSFSGLQTLFDWVLVKTSDTRLSKAGILKFCGGKKSIVVDFTSPFPDTDYYVFFTPNNNVNTYTVQKKANRFVVNASCDLNSEISWLAIHKEMAILTGVNNPGTIYAGQRVMTGEAALESPGGQLKETLDMTSSFDANKSEWYNSELIIKPEKSIDGNYIPMNLDDYSVILTSNNSINMFWIEKAVDRVKVGTSFPTACTVDYLIIKTGVNWWNEI
jgi:hypothetical protein